MQILLINDSTSNPNWGDRATIIALRNILYQCGFNIGSSISESTLSQIKFFNSSSRSFSAEKEFKLYEMISSNLLSYSIRAHSKISDLWYGEKKNLVVPNKWDHYDDAIDYWIRQKEKWSDLRKQIESADVVVIHGDGAISTRSNIVFSMLFLAYLAKFEMNKPVAIINHTVDPSDNDLEEIIHNLYPLLDHLRFRDIKSFEKFKNLCNSHYAPDTGFWFEPAPKEQWTPIVNRSNYMNIWPHQYDFNPTIPYLCIGGSSLFYPIDNQKIQILQKGYTRLVEKILTSWKGQIVFIASDRQDEKIFCPIANHYKAPFLPVVTPIQQAVDILGNAVAYIGGRWHAGIFALRGGVPIIPMASKTFKMSVLCEMAGLRSSLEDAFFLERDSFSVVERLKDLMNQGEDLRMKLRTWASEQAIAVSGNIDFLANINDSPNQNR